LTLDLLMDGRSCIDAKFGMLTLTLLRVLLFILVLLNVRLLVNDVAFLSMNEEPLRSES